MKKLAAGFLAGVIATAGATAYADDLEELVGKAVQGTFPFTIDGKKAPKDVIVIDGTSYVPVRAAGDMFGYDVAFTDETVRLTKKIAGSASGTGSKSPSTPKTPELPTGEVSIRTQLFTLSATKGTLVIQDGTPYLSAMVFEKYISSDGKTVDIRLPGRNSVQFKYTAEYETDCSGYQDVTGLYVSLTALGLSASPSGTTGILLVQK